MQLRLARVELGLNQAELATILETNQASASRIETGKQLPSLKEAIAIERRFGIPASAWVAKPSRKKVAA